MRKACHNDKHSIAIWLTKQIIHNRQEENIHLLVQEEEVWELHYAYSFITNLFVQLKQIYTSDTMALKSAAASFQMIPLGSTQAGSAEEMWHVKVGQHRPRTGVGHGVRVMPEGEMQRGLLRS